MSAKNPNTSTSAKGKDKATGPGANDPAATSENALVFLQKCIDIFSNCTPVMPVLEKLGQAMRDNENLKGHLDTIEKEMRDNEMNLRKTIEQKEAALIEARKGLLDSVWKDFSAKHDSTAKLKEKDQEMQQKLQEKDREISKLMAKHQSELTTQKKHLEEQGTKQQNELKRQIVRLTNEKEEAARDLEESRSLIERMNTEQQETTMLLNAAGVRERARERELATMQEEMGLKEVADDEFARQADELEMKFHSLCKRFFYKPDIAQNPTEPFNESLKSQLVRSGFMSRSEVERNFPILLNNTSWSKCLLMALAENTIANEMITFIFRVGLLDPAAGQQVTEYLEDVSDYLLHENPRNEARWRSISCVAMNKKEVENAIVQVILDRVEDIFGPLFDGKKMEEFHNSLDCILRDAIAFWKIAQRSNRKIIADFDELAEGPNDCQTHPEHTEIPVSNEERQEGNPAVDLMPKALPLFPRFAIMDEDEWRELNEGRALPPDAQSAVRSRAEMRQYVRLQMERHRASMSSNISVASRPITRRRPSISASNYANGETSPTQQSGHSPTSATRANGPSFGASDNQRAGPFFQRPPPRTAGNGGVHLPNGAGSVGNGGVHRERATRG